jgi:hypothetical protein
VSSDLSVFSPKVDVAIGAAATTSPYWMPYFNDASHVLIVVGGLALLALRIGIAVPELLEKWRGWLAKKRGG